MGAPRRILLLLFFAMLLVGCTSETRSVVSADDIPATRYRQIALFVENVPGPESATAEQIIGTALRSAGVRAVGKSEIFKDHEDMDAGAQANFIRAQGFDSVLYVTVLESGYVPEGVNTVSWNTPVMGFMFSGPRPAEWALKTKSELQDANTAKLVWSAETITSGIAEVSNINLLFTQASQQIINKLGTDHII